MEQYLITSYTFNKKIQLTNLIRNYNVKELYSTKTLHIHGSSCNEGEFLNYQNVKFEKLKKIKAKVIVYGNCYRMFYNSQFAGDISNWVTSSVTNMRGMFEKSQFNGVISNWDVSSVTNMRCMFFRSNFNGVISNWDVSSVTHMGWMFFRSNFNGVISNWDVSSVTNMDCMFQYSKFNGVISNWDTSSVKDTNMKCMFYNCPAKKPDWYYKYF